MNRLQRQLSLKPKLSAPCWRTRTDFLLRAVRIGTVLLFFLAQPPALAEQIASPVQESASKQNASVPKEYSIYFQTSLYTRHLDPSPDHTNHQKLINLEWRKETGNVWGFAFFRNSFDQPSQYIYGGRLFRPFEDHQYAYFKLTGGLVHGYKGEYRDKIPFNSLGIAPIILPAAGLSYNSFTTELVLFGAAGLMITLGYDFR